MLDEALAIIKYLKIVHHVKGRIRVKAGLGIIKDPIFRKAGGISEKKINEIGSSLPGVLDSRVNIKARSIVIRYDPGVIDPEELETLITTKDPSVSRAILEKYQTHQLNKEVVDV